MTAINAQFVSPKDRMVYEITKEVASMPLDDLSYVLNQITYLKAMRMAAQLRSAEIAAQQPPEPDPHGV